MQVDAKRGQSSGHCRSGFPAIGALNCLRGYARSPRVEWASPLADGELLEPHRTTSLDARLGEALLRLAAQVHFHLADVTGWLNGDRTTYLVLDLTSLLSSERGAFL